MRIEGTRFGTIELDDMSTIELPFGLIGFPDEKRFVLLERMSGRGVAYLQSLTTPSLALPVMDGSLFGDDYPKPAPERLAEDAGIGGGEVAVLVVAAVANGDRSLCVNMLAPIVIDLASKRGAQVVLDPRSYSASLKLSGGDDRRASQETAREMAAR
jgi:flagellar assembly factor FliW